MPEFPFDYFHHPATDRVIDTKGRTPGSGALAHWREMGLDECAVRVVAGDGADADPAALPNAALDGPGDSTLREDAMVGLAIAAGWHHGHCDDGYNVLEGFGGGAEYRTPSTEIEGLFGRYHAKASWVAEWETRGNFLLGLAMRLLLIDAEGRKSQGPSPACLRAVASLAGRAHFTNAPLVQALARGGEDAPPG